MSFGSAPCSSGAPAAASRNQRNNPLTNFYVFLLLRNHRRKTFTREVYQQSLPPPPLPTLPVVARTATYSAVVMLQESWVSHVQYLPVVRAVFLDFKRQTTSYFCLYNNIFSTPIPPPPRPPRLPGK